MQAHVCVDSTKVSDDIKYMYVDCLLQWADCMLVGRDLVRLLQYVARIPEFDKLWLDILTNPQSLSPHFQGTVTVTTLSS